MVGDATVTFGEMLRRHRLAAGLTQEELAERAGTSAQGVRSLERGYRQTPRRDTVKLLATALGLSAEERDQLQAAARRQSDVVPAAPAIRAHPVNLPPQPTPFIGRRTQVDAVEDLLLRFQVRLLTLTGTGGTGKTRLALGVAEEVKGHFPDGVHFVELAPIGDPDLVISVVIRALEIVESSGRPPMDSLLAYSRDKQMLLLLDNFEHVLEAAPLVSQLLAAAPAVKVLATSRTPLRLPGEHEYPVPPLSLPDRANLPSSGDLSRYEAVALFVERARAIRPDFGLEERNAAEVVNLCHRLEGIPLAIELAAAKVRAMGVEQIAVRLDDSLRLLVGGSRLVPLRQRSLQGALDWSYDLLEHQEAMLFRRLSVFAGGCDLEAAEAVCSGGEVYLEDVAELLGRLVEQSLVLAEARRGGGVLAAGGMRYRMLEPVRQYAARRLAESPESADLRRSHAQYYLGLGEEAEAELRGPRQGEWLGRLDREHDNLRAALEWAFERREAELGARLSTALWRYWYRRGQSREGRKWLDQVLASGAAVSSPLRARALTAAGVLAATQDNHELATRMLTDALSLQKALGDTGGVAIAHVHLGRVHLEQGEYEPAAQHFRESLALREGTEDQWGIAQSSNYLGLVALDRAEYAEAEQLLGRGLDLWQSGGDQWGIGVALGNLGLVALFTGDFERALELIEESRAVSQELGDSGAVANALGNLGRAALRTGRLQRARHAFEESLALQRKMGDREGIIECLEGFAEAAVASQELDRSVTLYAAADSQRAALGTPLTPAEQALIEGYFAPVRETLPQPEFRAAYNRGKRMSLDEAITFALSG